VTGSATEAGQLLAAGLAGSVLLVFAFTLGWDFVKGLIRG
jgi:hypothetical protein